MQKPTAYSRLSPQQINQIFKIWQNENPKPVTELKYQTPFQFLIAVILSAQSTDKQVNIVTKELFKTIKQPQDIIKLSENKIIQQIKSIGLYKTKARNILLTAKQIIINNNNQVPNKIDQLLSLPGVGIKTALVIQNEIYGKPTIAVDTHIFRVSSRTGMVIANSVEKLSNSIAQIIPKKYHQFAHHWMILHGRYTCIARKPKCSVCKIKCICYSYNN